MVPTAGFAPALCARFYGSKGLKHGPQKAEVPFLTYITLQCIELICYSQIRVHWRYATREIMEINKDLIAASSTPIVLVIPAEEDDYGYAILQRVREF